MENKFNYGPITSGMKEAPFYRKGMTPEEWEIENEYQMAHFQEWIDGTYQPLWKQPMKMKAFIRHINGEVEELGTQEEHIIIRLRRGEKIKCPDCGEAYVKSYIGPFGTDASDSHYFYCPNCDWCLYINPYMPEFKGV